MPESEIETVTLDKNIDHSLDAVLAQADRSKAGPLMIVGLEKSNPSWAKERPVLYALNMSRPDWPKELPRPLVFWIPDYLLGLMGREAPDFLDWRSDTLFFPAPVDEELLSLRPEVWLGEQNESMSERKRRVRVEELASRLASPFDSDDPVALAARAGWLKELGIHFFRLGEWRAARKSDLEALEIEKRLGRQEQTANLLGDLALLDEVQGRVREAEIALERALAIYESQGSRRGEVIGLANLANLHLRAGRLESAELLGRRALELAVKDASPNLVSLTPWLIGSVFGIMLGKKDFVAAKKLAEEALAAAAAAGSAFRRPEILRNLGVLSSVEGDLDRAERYFRESLQVARMLGEPVSAAESLLGLGLLYVEMDDDAAARSALIEAEQLFRETGDLASAERARKRLQELVEPLSSAKSH